MRNTIHIVPVLNDNYAYLVEGDGGDCIVIDPGDSGPVLDYMRSNALKAVAVVNTHHHGDHTGGNSDFSCPVHAPEKELSKIPSAHHGIKDGDMLSLAGIIMKAIETPGHTKGHLVFYMEATHDAPPALFAGDTLFSMGCGRLFEGSAEDMFASLQRLKELPPETRIYCGHEYTRSNAEFALSLEAENEALKKRAEDVAALRAQNLPTIPVTLETELLTNPFLRAESAALFAKLRERKDNF
ncbi:MAG: hydroxyacylglutathione hydrolase [Micavibrio sp.]